MHPLIGLAQLLGIGFGLYLISLIIYTMWGLARPHRQTYASAVFRILPGDPGELDVPIEFEEHTVKGINGDLQLWVLKANNPQGPCVIMIHGWGSSRQGGLKRLEPIIEHASQIIIWDLPGHGDSIGNTYLGSTEHDDLARIVESLDPGLPVVLYGWSMGAGIALAYAHEHADDHPVVSIICESPYVDAITPARNVVRLRGVPHRLNLKPAMLMLGTIFGVGPTWRGFARDEIAKEIDIPILILHGELDPVSPIEDAQKIASAAPNAELINIADGGHNNLWTDGIYRQQMCDAIGSFLNQTLLSQPSQTGSPAQP